MHCYLSSYKLGNAVDELRTLIARKRMGFISNALDFSTDTLRRQESDESEIASLRALGAHVEMLDLRTYFGKKEALASMLASLDGVWVRGGNTFVLRQAMELSGFAALFSRLVLRKDFVYAGYSAGICVLAPSLRGLQQCDDATQKPYGEHETIWDGLGLLDYLPLPHYDSDHPESAFVAQEVEYCQKQHIAYKTLRDGDVLIFEC